MAEKKIGAKIVIDGESEFRANLNSAKKALSNFESELKLVDTQYKNNANSLEALRAKQQVYIKLQEEQKNKVALLEDIQSKAIQKYNEEKNTLENLAKKRDNLNQALEDAKKTYGENSEEVQKLSSELEEANKSYEAQERAVQKTGDKVNTYQQQLNTARTELTNLNNQIEQNDKYMSEAEQSVDGCATSIDEFGNSVDDASDKTSVFGDVLKAELLSSAIKEGIKELASGIKTIATAAIDTGSTFEASMSQVAATMGITTDEIAKGSDAYETLNKAAQDCGKATMFSASQSAEALNYLALAGYDAEKAAETLPKVLNLAAAGGLDLAYASDLVTDSMAALGMETSELDNYIDEMAKTSQKSNTNVAQLGEATLVCAGTVSLAEQSLETMNTSLGVLANNGIKGAEGGTHLRNILLSLAAPTDNASVALDQLGINVEDSSGKMRDLNDIMIDMDKAMSDMSSVEKTKTINKIFNKTDISAVNALLKSTNGEYKNLNAQIKNCSGAAQDMADTLNDNLKGKVTILDSALEGLGITAYNLFDDEMKDAVDSATGAVGRLQDAIDNGDLGVSLDKMSKALGDFAGNAIETGEKAVPKLIDGLTWILENGDMLATLIGGLATAKLTYTAATKVATIAQQTFNIAANANPYILLATAIGGVAAAIGIYCANAEKVSGMSTETEKLVKASKDLNEQTTNAAKKRTETKVSFENEEQAAKNLVEELEELQDKTNLTASEQARMQSIVDQLNEAYPNLNLQIDEHTSNLNMDTDEILANIEATLQQAKVEAAREDLTEIAKEQYEVEKQLAELKGEETSAVQRLTDAEAALNAERDAGGSNVRYTEAAQEAYAQATADVENLRSQIEETQGTIDNLGTEYENTMQYIADNTAISDAAGDLDNLGNSASSTGDAVSAMSQEAIQAYNDMFEELQETVEKQLSLFDKFEAKCDLSTQDILNNMQSQVTGITEWSSNIQELADRGINQGLLKYLADMGPQGAGYVREFTEMTDEELQKANELFKEAMVLPTDTTSQIMDSYTRAGENAGEGFRDGLESKKKDILDLAEEMPKNSLEIMRNVLETHSPSKKTQEIGKNFDEGFLGGIRDNKPKVLDAIRQMTADALNKAKSGVREEEYKNVGTQITNGLTQGISAGRSGVLESIRSLCAATIQAAKNALDIHSPSKAFAYLGEMSGKGYITGWEQTMQNIDSIITASLPDFPSSTKNQIAGAQAVTNMQFADGTLDKLGEQNAGMLNTITQMFGIMQQYMPGMANMKMVTDTGALIGELVGGMDSELGSIERDRERE